ncbi:MAG: type 1 glutamine amidotransferase domain-containing protein [Gemmatimonadota bacterium]
MTGKLDGKKVAILVAKGFEQVEFTEPRQALRDAGAETHVVSPADGRVRGWQKGDWGDEFDVDVPLSQARPEDYDALVLPGGRINPDLLRMEPEAVAFARHFFDKGKPVAAICHAPWLLVEADVVRGRRVTSYPSLRKDLENAGAHWEDSEVVVDAGLVTSRNPDDLPAFTRKMVEEIAEGVHAGQHA